MVTILLGRGEFIRATHFTSADLFLGCSSVMAVGSKLCASLVDNLLLLTALLLNGQPDSEIPAAKIWPPTRSPVRDCIRPYFSERPTYENTRAMIKFGLIAGYKKNYFKIGLSLNPRGGKHIPSPFGTKGGGDGTFTWVFALSYNISKRFYL